jgi:DNA repair protein RecN (Recombination protein N)
VALAEADAIPVLIFDEIDIGVGGRSGEVIGKKLWALAHHHQIICVTHLPQIAVFADSQYGVKKESSDGRSTSSINVLDEREKTAEIAAMLGGDSDSELCTRNALDMMRKAADWKTKQSAS